MYLTCFIFRTCYLWPTLKNALAYHHLCTAPTTSHKAATLIRQLYSILARLSPLTKDCNITNASIIGCFITSMTFSIVGESNFLHCRLKRKLIKDHQLVEEIHKTPHKPWLTSLFPFLVHQRRTRRLARYLSIAHGVQYHEVRAPSPADFPTGWLTHEVHGQPHAVPRRATHRYQSTYSLSLVSGMRN